MQRAIKWLDTPETIYIIVHVPNNVRLGRINSSNKKDIWSTTLDIVLHFLWIICTNWYNSLIGPNRVWWPDSSQCMQGRLYTSYNLLSIYCVKQCMYFHT